MQQHLDGLTTQEKLQNCKRNYPKDTNTQQRLRLRLHYLRTPVGRRSGLDVLAPT